MKQDYLFHNIGFRCECPICQKLDIELVYDKRDLFKCQHCESGKWNLNILECSLCGRANFKDSIDQLLFQIEEEIGVREMKPMNDEKKRNELSLYSWMLSVLDYQNVWFDPVLVSLIELDLENKANYQKHLNEIDKLEFEYDTK